MHREPAGKRISPPYYFDEGAGFPALESLLQKSPVVIFCACSYRTITDSRYRCHRFFVADEMARRMPDLRVVHIEHTLVR
jgi:hypothetical protein